MPRSRPFFGLTLAAVFALLFVLLYGGASLLGHYRGAVFSPALPFEAALPLYPQWAAVYLSLPLFLLYTALRLDWRGQWRLFVLLCGALACGCVCFLLLPAHLDFAAAPPADGRQGVLLQLAYAAGMRHNYFLSLHCAFACIAAGVLQQGLSVRARAAVWLYAAAVVYSTVAIHAHHIADAVAGCLLAVLLWRPLTHWAWRSEVLAAVARQRLWLDNQIRFARRHRRYAFISLLLYSRYPFSPRRARLLLAGYCFLQAYDDVMDGDRSTAVPPDVLADGLIAQWQTGRFSGSPVAAADNESDTAQELSALAQAFYTEWQRLPEARDEDVTALLHCMRADCLRAQQRRVLPQQEWQAQMHDTFRLSLDLLFAAFGSRLRAAEVPELVQALAWCSAMRDWDEDMAAGIINLPAELWHKAGLPPPNPPPMSAADGRQISSNPIVAAWLAAQKQQTMQVLDALSDRLPEIRRCHGKPAAALVRLFARSVARFAQTRYVRRFG